MAALTLPRAAAQDSLNAEQQALRSELYEFLKGEGYLPEIDGDGDIAFKAEGEMHWITVSSADSSPFFVTVIRSAPYVENYDYDRVLHAADELNLYKTVKVEANDGFAVIKLPCISAVPPLSKMCSPNCSKSWTTHTKTSSGNMKMPGCAEKRGRTQRMKRPIRRSSTTGCGGCYNSDSSACTCRTSSSSDIQLIVR